MCLLPTTPYSVKAVAIEQNTARTAVSGAVNNHYLFAFQNFRKELFSQMYSGLLFWNMS